MSDEYWNIDVPGLSEAEAETIRGAVSADLAERMIVTSPKDFYVRGMDRDTVLALTAAIRAGLTTSHLADHERTSAEFLIEDAETWLEEAREV